MLCRVPPVWDLSNASTRGINSYDENGCGGVCVCRIITAGIVQRHQFLVNVTGLGPQGQVNIILVAPLVKRSTKGIVLRICHTPPAVVQLNQDANKPSPRVSKACLTPPVVVYTMNQDADASSILTRQVNLECGSR